MAHDIWRVGRGLLLSQGFPLAPGPVNVNYGAKCTGLALPRVGRRPAAVHGQAGNSMNVAVVGSVLIYAAWASRTADTLALVQLAMLLRPPMDKGSPQGMKKKLKRKASSSENIDKLPRM